MQRRYLFSSIFLLALYFLSVPGVALSAEGDSAVDSIVVTASRLDPLIAELTQSVQIIDRTEIDTYQAASVTELLRRVAGLNVIQQGARGGVTSVVMRGGESNFTVVLIDGIKVNDSTNTRGGSYDFSYLDLASIERIEIVRGPMSAIYGSDALAGVISIFTRAPDTGAEVRAEVGGHGLQSGRVALGGEMGSANAMIAVRALQEDGDIEGASYEDWGLDGSIHFDVGSSGEAGLVLRHQDADSTSFPEDSGGPALAVLRDVDQRAVTESHVRLHLDQSIGTDWRTSVALSRYERNEEASSPGIAPGVFDGVPPNAADTDYSRDQLLVSFSRELGMAAAVVLGGEWQKEDGKGTGFLDFGFPVMTDFRLKRDTLSAFAELEYQFDAVRVQGSLRWDDPDEIGDELSAQLGAVYTLPGDAGSVRMNWGEAFKAPSFFAVGHPLVGNPDLESETATSFDVGYRRAVGPSSSIEVSLYRNDFENLIDFDPELFTQVNRSNVVTSGIEFAGRWAINSSVNLDVHLAYADSEIKDSDAILRGRPEWRGGLGVDWRINEQWLLAASYLLLDEYWEVSIPTGGLYLDGYNRLDLAVSFDASDRLRFGFAIDNALDEEYFEAVGFPAAGVRARLNATYQF